MLKVPMPQQRYWKEAMRKVSKQVIKKGTLFVKAEPQCGDPIIPVSELDLRVGDMAKRDWYELERSERPNNV
jgi:hypothetical protein